MIKLPHSMFEYVLFPKTGKATSENDLQPSTLSLQKLVRFKPSLTTQIFSVPKVVFDLETTGLNAKFDRIIEIGALRIENGQIVEKFESLVNPERPLYKHITQITGITSSMLEKQPTITEVLPKFLNFIKRSILVAHNAEFDMGFLKSHCDKLGIDLEWPSFCTLKMARKLLSDLPRKTLDALAKHYDLTFESRHRSIGDAKVTNSVMHKLLSEIPDSSKITWSDMKEFWTTN